MDNTLSDFLHSHRFTLLLTLLICFIAFFHLWRIDTLPAGLYVDESSIGLNAALIADTGHDEHGALLPVYFEAFGDYKNPIYVYAAASLFKILGVSELTLRLTSFCFFYIFIAGLLLLLEDLFEKQPSVIVFGLLAAGFLPWFFPLSRIAFEVVSQLGIVVWSLYLIHKTYEQNNASTRLALLTGIVTMVTLYTYSTARLLTMGSIILLLVCYPHRDYWRRHLNFILGATVAFIPYLIFAFRHGGALTQRFKILTFVYDPSLTILEKISLFTHNYFSYFSLPYLTVHGDTNLRHATGFGGELYWTVLILAILGLGYGLYLAIKQRAKFPTFLIVNLLIAPMAAALTNGDSALRSVLIGVYVVIFSCYGLGWLLRLNRQQRLSVSLIVFVTLTIEIRGYLTDYFKVYPSKTITAFESYDFAGTLQKAYAMKPDDIVVSKEANQPYAHLEFYRRTESFAGSLPARVDLPVAADSRCIIYFAFNETIVEAQKFARQDLETPGNYTKLSCFSLPTAKEQP